MNKHERPFALPADSIEIVLDLPFPPSVNHIWRRAGKRMIRSARYMRWIENTDALVLLNRQYPRRKITGDFELDLLLDEQAGRGVSGFRGIRAAPCGGEARLARPRSLPPRIAAGDQARRRRHDPDLFCEGDGAGTRALTTAVPGWFVT